MTTSAMVVLLAFALGACVVGVGAALRARNMHYWLGSYVRDRSKRRRAMETGTTLYVCIADHFEPYNGRAARERAHARVQRWAESYPKIAGRHGDSLGRRPCHTFFYPIEEYDADILDTLKSLVSARLGSVEVHYHHDGDTAENLRRQLLTFAHTLRHGHGLLRDGAAGEIAYCFVHGNWALDNSRPDGRWCGVDDEISVLVQTGCKADFTLPSAPDATQTRKINSIYFCKGRPGLRKSHDSGRDAAVGEWGGNDELLIVQGPLGLNWRSRKLGVLPRIENAEISADAPPNAQRLDLWTRFAPAIRGAENHVFLKLHTHGAEDATMGALLDGGLERLWTDLEERFRDRAGHRLRYVSAWEMYTIARELAIGSAVE